MKSEKIDLQNRKESEIDIKRKTKSNIDARECIFSVYFQKKLTHFVIDVGAKNANAEHFSLTKAFFPKTQN